MKDLKFIVQEDEGMRLDLFLSNKIKDYSRSQLQKIMKETVLVNDVKKKGNYRIQIGDIIELSLPGESKEIKKKRKHLISDMKMKIFSYYLKKRTRLSIRRILSEKILL